MPKLMVKKDVCQTCYGSGTNNDKRLKEKTCPVCKGSGETLTLVSNEERIERLERLVELLIERIDRRADLIPTNLVEGIVAIDSDSKFIKVD